MKLVVDSHSHTLASGHAYSTLAEMAQGAAEKGIELLCNTDHGVAMPGSAHIYYFANMHVYPESIHGVEIYKGVEANIMDYEGTLDMEEEYLEKMDIVIASYHPPCVSPASKELHTQGLLKVIENPYVNVLGHSGNPKYDFYHEEVIIKAKQHKVLIEVNNSSLNPASFRVGSRENCKKILELCKKHDVYITLGTDSHIANDVGSFPFALALLEEIHFPQELILNTSVQKFKNYIQQKRSLRNS